MNSSGIVKKGLAASAISALAITGVPALTSPANAAPGDSFTVVSVGPALDGGNVGSEIVIRALDGTITPAALDVTGSTSATNGSEDVPGEQTVDVEGFDAVAVNDTANPAFEFITVRVSVNNAGPGTATSFRLFEDDNLPAGTSTDDVLDVDEARAPVTVTTSGPVAQIAIEPSNRTAPDGVESAPYDVTLKDAAGRTTQLAEPTDAIVIAASGGADVDEVAPNVDNNSITGLEIADGTNRITANSVGNGEGVYNITLTGPGLPAAAVVGNATLSVVEAAVLGVNEINIVTPDEADTWNGFRNPGDVDAASVTAVRVDQDLITFNFDALPGQAGSNVSLTVNGDGGVTFGGQDQATYTTTLDGNGNGSIPVTPQNVTEAGSFTANINGFTQTINFDRAAVARVAPESATYFCQFDSACTVTAVVTDQFGDPVTSGEVRARRVGPANTDAPAAAQRKPVGSDGTVDFTFTDVNAGNNGTDTVEFDYFTDAFDADPTLPAITVVDATIRYNTTGQGNDFVVSLDNNSAEAPTYTADAVGIIPLTDTVASATTDPGDESNEIGLTGGNPGQQVTLSVDGGALILSPNDNDLSDGEASVNTTLTAGGALPTGYRVVGTTSGLATLTVASGNRTETAQFTVRTQTDANAARNLTVAGPATTPSDADQVTFTATVTDAFGNPVVNAPVFLNVQVSGPGFYQDGSVVTDANGMVELNVRLDDDAEGPVVVRVTGVGAQFGAQAGRLTATSPTNDGSGLTASSPTATATTIVDGPVVPPVPPVRSETDATLVENKKTGGKIDKLRVNTVSENVANDARVNLFRINKKGQRVLVESSQLNSNGIKRFQVADTNGKKVTTYVARVRATDDTQGDKRSNRETAR